MQSILAYDMNLLAYNMVKLTMITRILFVHWAQDKISFLKVTLTQPRYKAGTSIVSNLLYDTSLSQVKCFVDGTNVNNQSQYIYFYYTKALTAKEQAALCVERNTALAKTGWTGTKIGSVQVTYTSTSVTKLKGTTSNLPSSMLSTHRYNGKTFGTADNPLVGITKTGNVDTQKIIIETNGY